MKTVLIHAERKALVASKYEAFLKGTLEITYDPATLAVATSEFDREDPLFDTLIKCHDEVVIMDFEEDKAEIVMGTTYFWLGEEYTDLAVLLKDFLITIEGDITVQQAADELGILYPRAYGLFKHGDIQSHCFNNERVTTRENLDAYKATLAKPVSKRRRRIKPAPHARKADE